MTLAYEPKHVAVSALALACFSVGFSVTVAAHLGVAGAPQAESPRASSNSEHAATAPVVLDATRGCRSGG